MRHPPQPSGDDCSAHAPVKWVDDHGNECNGFAIWYPQMGGYVGKAVVEPGGKGPDDADEDACFEVWVWHDGEFPFGEGQPAQLHHCAASQFIRFGQEVAELMKGRSDADG